MLAKSPKSARIPSGLWMDLALVAFLIGLDVVARVAPHHYGFLPVAASALFAGRVLRIPALAPVVPVAAMVLSALALGADDWRISLVVTAAISLPASSASCRAAGPASRQRRPSWRPARSLSSRCRISRSGPSAALYSLDVAGLTECYVAALPFLQNTVAGDLFWTAVLFGGAWMIQNGAALAGKAR